MRAAAATSHCTHSLDRAQLGRGEREKDTRACRCSVTLSDCISLGTLVCMCEVILMCVLVHVCQGLETRVSVCVRAEELKSPRSAHTHYIRTETPSFYLIGRHYETPKH